MISVNYFAEKVRALAPNAIIKTYLYDRGRFHEKPLDEIDHTAISGFTKKGTLSHYFNHPRVYAPSLPPPVTFRLGFAYLYPEFLPPKDWAGLYIPPDVVLSAEQLRSIPLLEDENPSYLNCITDVYYGKPRSFTHQNFYEYGCLSLCHKKLLSIAFNLHYGRQHANACWFENTLSGFFNCAIFAQLIMTDVNPEWQKVYEFLGIEKPRSYWDNPLQFELKPWYPSIQQETVIHTLSTYVFMFNPNFKGAVFWEGDELGSYFLAESNLLHLSNNWYESSNPNVILVGNSFERLRQTGVYHPQQIRANAYEFFDLVQTVLQQFKVRRAVFLPPRVVASSFVQMLSDIEQLCSSPIKPEIA